MIHKHRHPFCPLKEADGVNLTACSSILRFHPSERSNGRDCPAAPGLSLKSDEATLCALSREPAANTLHSGARSFQPPPLEEKISPNLTLPRAMPTCRHRSQRQLDTRTDRQTDGVAPSVRAYEGPTAFHVGWTLWTDIHT